MSWSEALAWYAFGMANLALVLSIANAIRKQRQHDREIERNRDELGSNYP